MSTVTTITNPHTDVQKKVLSNGMTILVRPVHNIPKVSIQLWYYVGSKDEKDRERGIAHLIEHMIFKGTQKLSESDIDTITRKLSGSINAFTSYDYTGYLFNFPKQHWQEAFSIMSDCMRNCSFKEQHLNSEMKAVIQELKMYKDDYIRSLLDEMIGTIFADHPYHHPIIGYKQDLWSVTADNLRAFYSKHYVPNNATLVVVGDVDPEEVFALSEKYFASIARDESYKKEDFYLNKDIVSKTVTLYRDVKQPVVIFAFVVPGLKDKKDHLLDLIARIIGEGKSSRLYKKLVNELQLATSISASSEELYDFGLFFIVVEPKNATVIDRIQEEVLKELNAMVQNGATKEELERAIKSAKIDLYSLLEDIETQAYEIGKYYLATGNPSYRFHYLDETPEQLNKEIHQIMARYMRPSLLQKGTILPLPEEDKDVWLVFQQESDESDQKILSKHQRTQPIEKPVQANNVQVKKPEVFPFPKAQTIVSDNGLKVLYYHNPNTPKIDIILDLPSKHYRDPEGKDGLAQFVSKMILEGTKKYTGDELAHAIEQRGMSVSVFPGGVGISLLAEDLPFALSILNELVTSATFPAKEMEKVRTQLLTKVNKFWDEPRYFTAQLAKEQIYKGHPYAKSSIGTVKGISAITRDDLQTFYERYFTPATSRLAIVGDLQGYDVAREVGQAFKSWSGKKVDDIVFPRVLDAEQVEINFPINRDQVVLRFAGRSIERTHPDYDNLVLFDQIFAGGALGSMSSRLFQLREQSGLFYTIGGSTVYGADEQPGMITVQTIVSLDRLDEAERAITDLIEQVPATITEEELEHAKNGMINTAVDHFASNASMAQAFLFLDRFGFPQNYFDERGKKLSAITLDTVKTAARQLVDPTRMLTLRVGRVGKVD